MPVIWSPTSPIWSSNAPTATTTHLYIIPTNMTTATNSTGNWSWFGSNIPSQTYAIWQEAGTTGDGEHWRWLTTPVDDDRWHAMGQALVRHQREQERVAAPAIIRDRERSEFDRQVRAAISRMEERERQRQDATARAQELLLENLTPEQRAMFERNKWFVVYGKQRYRIRADRGVVANIDVLDRNDRVTHRLCGHCDHTVPFGDQLLAQKMMLEFAEDDFLRIANRHGA